MPGCWAETVTAEEATCPVVAAAVTVALPADTAVTRQELPACVAVATAALLEVQEASVGAVVVLPPVTCTAKTNDSPMFIAALLGVMMITTGLTCTGTVTSSPHAARPLIAARLAVSNAFFREKKCILPPSFEVVGVTAATEHNTRRDGTTSCLKRQPEVQRLQPE